jgi:hypothetical protein
VILDFDLMVLEMAWLVVYDRISMAMLDLEVQSSLDPE